MMKIEKALGKILEEFEVLACEEDQWGRKELSWVIHNYTEYEFERFDVKLVLYDVEDIIIDTVIIYTQGLPVGKAKKIRTTVDKDVVSATISIDDYVISKDTLPKKNPREIGDYIEEKAKKCKHPEHKFCNNYQRKTASIKYLCDLEVFSEEEARQIIEFIQEQHNKVRKDLRDRHNRNEIEGISDSKEDYLPVFEEGCFFDPEDGFGVDEDFFCDEHTENDLAEESKEKGATEYGDGLISEDKFQLIKSEYACEFDLENIDSLSVRALNCLKRAGIKNLKELQGYSVSELKKTHNFGRKTCQEIIRILDMYGIRMKPTEINNIVVFSSPFKVTDREWGHKWIGFFQGKRFEVITKRNAEWRYDETERMIKYEFGKEEEDKLPEELRRLLFSASLPVSYFLSRGDRMLSVEVVMQLIEKGYDIDKLERISYSKYWENEKPYLCRYVEIATGKIVVEIREDKTVIWNE